MSTATLGSPGGSRARALTLIETRAASSARGRDPPVLLGQLGEGEGLAHLPRAHARLGVPRVLGEDHPQSVEGPRVLPEAAQHLGQAEARLAVSHRVRGQSLRRALRVALPEQQVSERQAEARHLGSALEGLAVGRDGGSGVAIVQRLPRLRHPLLRQPQLDLGQPPAGPPVVGRDRAGPAVELERLLELAPSHGHRRGPHQGRQVLRTARQRRLERVPGLGHPPRAQMRVGQARFGGQEPRPPKKELAEGLFRPARVAGEDLAPGLLDALGFRRSKLARAAGREEVVFPLGGPGHKRPCAAGGHERRRQERERGRPQSSCSRYRSRTRTGRSAVRRTSSPWRSCATTRPAE